MLCGIADKERKAEIEKRVNYGLLSRNGNGKGWGWRGGGVGGSLSFLVLALVLGEEHTVVKPMNLRVPEGRCVRSSYVYF